MLAISIPAFLFADRWGRRTSAITGGITLSSCMFLMSTLYAAGVVHPWGAARWVVICSVFVFGLTYCATWGIVGKIYASEIQPGHTRAAANCVAQGLGFVSTPKKNSVLHCRSGSLRSSTVYQLARRNSDAHSPGQVCVWRLLPLRWPSARHGRRAGCLHARDPWPVS